MVHGFMPGPGGGLLVCLHRQPRPSPALLISSALGVTFTEPRYLMTLLARVAADAGYTVVQYDHPAEGDSAGLPGKATAADLLEAGEDMARFAHSLSDGRVVAVGYGAGNAVVTSLLESRGVDRAALIGPSLRAWTHADWPGLCPAGDDGLVAPPVTADGTELGDVWRAVYGEPVVPSQPPGPIHPAVLRSLSSMNPADTLRRRDRDVLIISDLPGDLETAAGDGVLLRHSPTADQPSWHWNMSCRQQVLDSIIHWLDQDTTGGRSVTTGQPRQAVTLPQPSDGTYQEAVHVRVAGEDVRGILRSAPGANGAGRVCVIYETGNPGQRVDIHRCAPVAAAMLASHGISSFRYDPRGMGSSSGAYHEMTWSRRAEDLRAVIKMLAGRGFTSLVILGNSAGARTALSVAETDPRISGLVLWGPILSESDDPPNHPTLVRVPGGLATEWCGLPLGLSYQRDVRGLDYLAKLRMDKTPTCIVFADDEPDKDNQRAVLEAVHHRHEVTVRTSPGQHGFSWTGLGDALGLTMDWINELTAANADTSVM